MLRRIVVSVAGIGLPVDGAHYVALHLVPSRQRRPGARRDSRRCVGVEVKRVATVENVEGTAASSSVGG